MEIKTVDISDGNRLTVQHINYIFCLSMTDWKVEMFGGILVSNLYFLKHNR